MHAEPWPQLELYNSPEFSGKWDVFSHIRTYSKQGGFSMSSRSLTSVEFKGAVVPRAD